MKIIYRMDIQLENTIDKLRLQKRYRRYNLRLFHNVFAVSYSFQPAFTILHKFEESTFFSLEGVFYSFSSLEDEYISMIFFQPRGIMLGFEISHI